MKTTVRIIAVLLLCSAAGVQAAPCRSAAAAAQGSQNGYQKDVQAAQQTAQREKSSSDILGRCVNGVTAVFTAPQFPSLSSIFDQIKNRVCQIASDQINGQVANVNQQINGALSGINGQIQNTGIGGIVGPGNIPTIGGPVLQPTHPPIVQPTTPVTPPGTTFWSNIWQ